MKYFLMVVILSSFSAAQDGANDFRVSEEQGFQLFTSLQKLGVKSKFLYFPDETHFVTKPQNSKLWWNNFQLV